MRTAWSPAAIARHVVGNALVLYAHDEISPEAQAMALEVLPDSEHDIVVLDLHADLPAGIWEAVAEALDGSRRDLRLIVCGAGRETALLAGQFLADRLGRAVLAPDGELIRSGSGALFAHGGEGSGWIRYRPGRPPEWTAKRYPAPAWDALVAESLPTSAGGVADPLPGGVWLHRTGEEAAEHAGWLADEMPCDPDELTVVVGSPGAPALALDDVARFWRMLGDDARDHARFVRYGEVRLSEGVSFGQALADLLETPVVCLTGVPTGHPENPAIHTVASDGGPGWQTFARELRFEPHAAAPPMILGYRAPAELGSPIGPMQFQYAGDAVVEIVEAGLWIRGNGLPWYVSDVRSRALDPDRFEVLIDDADPAQVARLRQLAEDLVARLDPETRQRAGFLMASTSEPAGAFVEALTAPIAAAATFEPIESPAFDLAPLSVVELAPAAAPAFEPPASAPASAFAPPAPASVSPAPASAPAEHSWASEPTVGLPTIASARVRPVAPAQVQVPVPVPAPAPAPVAAAEPAPSVPLGFFQATPALTARAVPDRDLLADDRRWLSDTFAPQFEAARIEVERVLSRYPGFEAEPDLIADSAALHMYLTAFGVGLSQTLHGGAPGPQVPYARCVASGLARMPEHHGPALLSADLNATELSWIATRPVLTEWGFTEALTAPADLPGTVDVLIWSAGGFRTKPLEPTGEHHADKRVVFPPGTRFQVLRTTPPTPEARGRLLLRHLPPGVRPDLLADDVIVAELERAADQWHAAPAKVAIGPAALHRFAHVPGLGAIAA